MTWYLGPAGNLQAIKAPVLGADATLARVGGSHQLLGGGAVRDTLGYKRTYTLTWRHLTSDEYGLLEALYVGAFGPGPFVFLDPKRRNLLTANQSSGTDALRDATGFVARSGQTADVSLASSMQSAQQGARALAATITTHAAGAGWKGDQDVAKPYVLPSTSYTFSAYVKRGTATDAGDTGVGVKLAIQWYTAAGSVTSSDATGTEVTPGTSWARASVTGTSPSDAAWALLYIDTQDAITTKVEWLFDAMQFEQASSASDWVVGTGVPLVFIDALTDSYPLSGRHDVTMVLREV